MNNDELKKDILSIVKGAMLEADELPFIETAEHIVDALIAAGIGDVSEYKHRAERAERALLWLCDKTMSDITVMVFPSTKTQVQNKQELYDYCIKQAEKEIAEE